MRSFISKSAFLVNPKAHAMRHLLPPCITTGADVLYSSIDKPTLGTLTFLRTALCGNPWRG